MDEEVQKTLDEIYSDLVFEALQTGKVSFNTGVDTVTLEWNVEDYTAVVEDKS